MKTLPALLALGLGPLFAFAADQPGEKHPVVPKDYPMQTCVVTGDVLSEHEPVTHTHSEAGKPDRVVVLCCEHCVPDFKRDPARYLKKLDEAAAAARQGGAKSDSADQKQDNTGHTH